MVRSCARRCAAASQPARATSSPACAGSTSTLPPANAARVASGSWPEPSRRSRSAMRSTRPGKRGSWSATRPGCAGARCRPRTPRASRRSAPSGATAGSAGIEPDVATVITQHAVRALLAPGGTLAFVITGTVFANESSERFRRFEGAKVLLVEDYAAVRPFAEATHPTLLVLRKGEPTTYPVPYRVTAATASRSCSPRPSRARTPGRGSRARRSSTRRGGRSSARAPTGRARASPPT